MASITLAAATGVYASFAMAPNEDSIITGNKLIRPADKETAQTARAAADSADVTAAFKDLKFQTSARKALGLSSNAPITKTAWRPRPKCHEKIGKNYSLLFSPQTHNWSKTSIKDFPLSLKLYSTLGGI